MDQSASAAFPYHLFLPFIKYPPSTFLAVVDILVASDPLSGSVKQKQHSFFRATKSGKNLAFYSSLQQASNTAMPRPFCKNTNRARPES